eukprot:2005492-Amphidinium_carterae.1
MAVVPGHGASHEVHVCHLDHFGPRDLPLCCPHDSAVGHHHVEFAAAPRGTVGTTLRTERSSDTSIGTRMGSR